MPSLLQEVENTANNLSKKERAELAHKLIVSLNDEIDEGFEEAWKAEIEKRLKEIKSGKAKGRPAQEILAEIRAKYS
ncbi:addiction module protein [Candidatus Poribacteria bacterium]|nr:addiction module protein [Candidatus Poribacteria bacterium]